MNWDKQRPKNEKRKTTTKHKRKAPMNRNAVWWPIWRIPLQIFYLNFGMYYSIQSHNDCTLCSFPPFLSLSLLKFSIWKRCRQFIRSWFVTREMNVLCKIVEEEFSRWLFFHIYFWFKIRLFFSSVTFFYSHSLSHPLTSSAIFIFHRNLNGYSHFSFRSITLKSHTKYETILHFAIQNSVFYLIFQIALLTLPQNAFFFFSVLWNEQRNNCQQNHFDNKRRYFYRVNLFDNYIYGECRSMHLTSFIMRHTNNNRFHHKYNGPLHTAKENDTKSTHEKAMQKSYETIYMEIIW